MPEINKTLKFFITSIIVFILMHAIFSFTGIEDGTIQLLRDSFTKNFNSEHQVAMFQPNDDYKEWDTKLVVYRTDIYENGEFQYYSTKYLSYISLLMFISLVLASPISWKRKGIGLLFGMILMLIYSNFMAGVIVHNLGYKIKGLANVEYNNFLYNINQKIFEIFILHGFEWMGLLPFIFWFLTTIKLSDFDLNLGTVKKIVTTEKRTEKEVATKNRKGHSKKRS